MRCLLFLFLIPGINPLIAQRVIGDIHVPDGYVRREMEEGSFGDFLRDLTLKEDRTVYLYNGQLKNNQGAQYAVLDVDVGNRDLQQCADAVMRLRGEFLFREKRYEDIHFNFTNGDRVDFMKYSEGYRPVIQGNQVSWNKSASADISYPCFRNYMTLIFTYAGSHSLEQELLAVQDIAEIVPGNVFIQGGFPGHAVIVLDVAYHQETGEKIFLLAQSYMPAQDIHILVNPTESDLSPWYLAIPGPLLTPEWKFHSTDLKKFR